MPGMCKEFQNILGNCLYSGILIVDQYLTKKERLEMLSSFRDELIEVVNDTFKIELSRGSVDYNFIML